MISRTEKKKMANSNNDWSQFYNNNQTFLTATTTTTTATSAESPLSPESRRVSKPRRRSRASRRTPTTLLNTDASNFRAMVQQFTGGPSAMAFGSSSSDFSLTSSDPTAGVSSFSYQVPWQYANLQNQTVHHELPQQQRPYMFSSSNYVSTNYPTAVVSDGFVAANESRDGGGRGIGYAPSSERNSNTTSWLQ